MKKNISINLQGLIFHIEEDGYEVLGRYLTEVKAHFASFRGHQDIVADIEGRIAEIFAARLSAAKQVITLDDVEAMTAKMGRVSDFASDLDEEDETETTGAFAGAAGAGAAYAAGAATAAAGAPKRLFRDMAHRKIAGVAAGLAQYLAVSPLWIRLGFVALVLFKPFLRIGHTMDFDNPVNLSGFAVLLYVILWVLLPKRYDAPDPDTIAPGAGPLAGRRLFRDTDTGKIGGVAGGLAYYLNLDVTLVRVLLLAGLLAGGFTFVLYIILWVVAPEAKTVSEKMQMRGEGVTLSGIDNNLRATAFDADGNPVAPAPNRPVGAFLEGAARGARPAVSFLGTLIRWGVGALLIFMGGSVLFGLFTALGVVAGMIPFNSLTSNGRGGIHFDDGSSAQNFAAVLHNVHPWAGVVALLAVGIPFLALVLLGLRLLLRRPMLGRTAGLSLLGLWLVGVMGTAVAAGQVKREFRTRDSMVTTRNLAPVAGRGFVLTVRDEDDDNFFERVDFNLAPADSGKAPYIEQEVTARGISAAAARQAAATVQYNLEQKDSVLTLDRGFTLTNDAPYRDQKVALTLHLPLDKNYRLTRAFIDRLDDDDFQGNRRPSGDQPHRARLLRSGRFQCLDCANASASEDDNDNSDADTSSDDNSNDDGDDSSDSKSGLSLNYGGAPSFDTDLGSYGSARRSFNETDFTRVNVVGGYRVVVRHGDAFKIEAGGAEDELNDLRVSRDGNALEIKPRDTSIFGKDWNRDQQKVLIRIEMPAVESLELAGGIQADLGGFDRQDRLQVQQAGVSHLRLNGNYGTLKISLAGPCHTTATGHADDLTLDAAGASELAGANLQTRTAKVSLVGACKARLNVSETLKGDAVGGSEVAYSGNPKSVKVSSIGGSSFHRL
ncbi:PspC domain-containing protein [Hymenobacter caeli]|uniref:Phage shock protein PspC (Stress-responsive transcriptional regulator) n=1 Tax=Hymenobacter caeli TaxID=2735894 RepID=A0ABX2FSG6_9BACT|nr:PspC domain-containing protein [Hymenobacter caeli]NRT19404.1 phage shock protein PspC (stress-responsive transcriptional regulator) [Hymenobacter caeli]